jgi:uncharacterized membrane protein
LGGAKSKERILLANTSIIATLITLQYFVSVSLDLLFKGYFWASDGLVQRWSGGYFIVAALSLVSFLARRGLAGESRPKYSYYYEALSLLSLFAFANLELHRYTTQFMPNIETAGYSVLWSLFAIGLILPGICVPEKPTGPQR